MDQIKKVFSPGSTKDDELMYGNEDARRRASLGKEPATEPELHPVEGSRKGSGILRQILNPGGNKYDEQAYGTNASTDKPAIDPTKLQTDPEVKDHTILGQIINPGGAKYDEQRHGSTAATAGDRRASIPTEAATIDPSTKLESNPEAEDRSILKQILNPGRDKHDDVAHGTTARTVDDQSHTAAGTGAAAAGAGGYAAHQYGQRDSEAPNTGSTLHAKGQTDGLSAGTTSTQAAHDGSGTHNYGRDAAIAGSSGVAGGAVEKSRNDNDVQKGDTVLAATSTAPISKPLGSSSETEQGRSAYGTPAGTGYTEQLGAGSTDHSSRSGVQGGHINPIGAPEESLVGSQSHHGRDAAIAGGLATAGAGAGYAATSGHDNNAPTQINTAPDDVKNATYTARSYPVGGSTSATVEPLPGHIPGEFPTEAGEDPHEHTRLGAVAAPLASSQRDVNPQTESSNPGSGHTWTDLRGEGYSASESVQHPGEQRAASSNYSSPPATGNEQHHYGRDTAVVGGVGAAGAAAYAAMSGKRNEPTASSQIPGLADRSHQPIQATGGPSTTTITSPTTTTTTTTTVASNKPITTSTNTYQQPPIAQQTTQPKEDTHYGRDAAVVGGVGAAGAGAGAAYAVHHHEQTVASSSTAGAQSSDQARVAAQTAARDHDYQTRDAAAASGIAGTTAAAYGTEDPNKHNKLHKSSPDEKHDTKEIEKEHKKQEKEAEKEQKRHEKELEKQHKEAEKEKKPSLISRILHPGRKGDEKEEVDHSQGRKVGEVNPDLNHPTLAGRQVAEQRDAGTLGAGAVGAGAVGAGAAAQHPGRMGDELEEAGHSHGRKVGEFNPDLNHPTLAGRQVAEQRDAGTLGAGAVGAGAVGAGTAGHPSGIAHGSTTGEHNRVTEPHTGLPMDLSKGDGHGGTDAAPQIPGFHETSGSGAVGADWDAIKKANTPY